MSKSRLPKRYHKLALAPEDIDMLAADFHAAAERFRAAVPSDSEVLPWTDHRAATYHRFIAEQILRQYHLFKQTAPAEAFGFGAEKSAFYAVPRPADPGGPGVA